MKVGQHLNEVAGLTVANRTLRAGFWVVLGLLGVNLIMMIYVMSQQRVILVFPGIDEKAEFTGNDANDFYVDRFARYALSLRFTFTPATVERSFSSLLTHYAPQGFTGGQMELMRDQESVVEGGISSVFYPYEVFIFRSKKEIEVEGLRQIYANGTPLEEVSGMRTYIIGYTIIDGTMMVNSIVEKKGP